MFRAVYYDSRGVGGMSYGTVEVPALPPKPNHILVEVRSVSINPVDYKKMAIPVMNWGLQNVPVSQDFAGVVVDAAGTTTFKIGDAVYGNAGGCMAERIWVAENEIALKPKIWSFTEAASLPTVGLTSLQALRAGGTESGSKVVVVGASGGCGLAGIMIARHIVGSSGKVLGVCGTSNIDFVRSLGIVDEVLDYRKPESIVGPDSILHSLKPVDVVYDTVSSPDTGDSLNGTPYDEVFRPYLKKKGFVCAINGSAGRWIGALTGWQGSGYKLLMKAKSGSQLRELTEMVEAGSLKAVVDSSHSFSEEGVRAAYERVKSRRSVGKVCVNVKDADSIE